METIENGKAWKNFGDVNFLEYGGCLVRPSYSSEEITKHPGLKSCFDVLNVDPEAGEEGQVFAELHSVDVDDYANDPDKRLEVLTAIGLEGYDDDQIKQMLSDDQFAKEIVCCGLADYVTHYNQPHGAASGSEGRFITRKDLEDWIRNLGAAECVGLDEEIVDETSESLDTADDSANDTEGKINVDGINTDSEHHSRSRGAEIKNSSSEDSGSHSVSDASGDEYFPSEPSADGAYVWVPEMSVFYMMQLSSQLEAEDYEAGYDAGIDYTSYKYDGDDIHKLDEEDFEECYDDPDFHELDGGIMTYKSEEHQNWTEQIMDVIRLDRDLDDDVTVDYEILWFF